MEKNSTINICGKRTLEYVFECIAKFNRKQDFVKIRAIGGSISKGVEVARILNDEFNVKIDDCKIDKYCIDNMVISYIEITLICKYEEINVRENVNIIINNITSKFIDYTIYNLLFDWQLFINKRLEISTYKNNKLITINEINGKINYSIKAEKKDKNTYDNIGSALYRCGLLFPENWKEIANKLSEYDDIILGIDTNILYNCSISEHLIPSLTLINCKKYIYTPNWLLFVIPSAVMHELEEAANIRSNEGFLKHAGRMGFRALQEIIELSQNPDIVGVSIIIVGEANPVLDTRIELQGLRNDFYNMNMINKENRVFKRKTKTSSGDMIIRDQFKKFLRKIDFHKGVYFLTADKTNVALARTEGLHPIYFKFPGKVYYGNRVIKPFIISNNTYNDISIDIPIGKLIYEFAVEFGSITINIGNAEILIHCDSKGENLDNWLKRQLIIEKKYLRILLGEYESMFNFDDLLKKCNDLNENFIDKERV